MAVNRQVEISVLVYSQLKDSEFTLKRAVQNDAAS